MEFEDFMKNIRRCEESRFMDRFMLNEYIQSYCNFKSEIR